MIHTTPERTLELIDQAVRERGKEFVYPTEWKTHAGRWDDEVLDLAYDRAPTLCMYVQRDQVGPACIVGYVLHEYGVSLGELSSTEGIAASGACESFGVDIESRELLMTAQNAQDVGKSWGEALDIARDEYEAQEL